MLSAHQINLYPFCQQKRKNTFATSKYFLPLLLQTLRLQFFNSFFELALIRFIPSNVRITAYFINLVLVAAFLGMGIGMIRVKRGKDLTQNFLPLLLLLTGACVYFSNVLVVTPRSGEAMYALYLSLATQQGMGNGSGCDLLFYPFRPAFYSPG